MNNLNVSNINQEPKYKNKGLIAGYVVNSLAMVPVTKAVKMLNKPLAKVSRLSADDMVILSNATEKGLKNSGLFDKGVRILKFEENPAQESFKEGLKRISKDFKYEGEDSVGKFINSLGGIFKYSEKDKPALNVMKDAICANPKNVKNFEKIKNVAESFGLHYDTNQIADFSAKVNCLPFKRGKNAANIPSVNKILAPDKSLQPALFHEMGHALNNNGGIFLKTLQKCRSLSSKIPMAVLLISLLNKRKTTDEQKANDSSLQKSEDFVKRNAGKLTFLSFIPKLVEEGLASLRGQNIAKTLVKSGDLTKELFKKVKLTNALGFSTYLVCAAGTALAVKLAVDVKDKIQAKYEAKHKTV